MRSHRLGILLALPVAAGSMAIFGASFATAAPSENASCVAKYVHTPEIGPPGQTLRVFHIPRFGEEVSFVAHLPKDDCFNQPQ
jgi:hypothetical protein